MERSERPVDDFIASLDDDIRITMEQVDEAIVGAMPGRRRVLWEGVFWGGTEQAIIGYGDIVQPRSKGEEVEWFIVGLARQKKHYSLYVNAAEDGGYLLRKYEDRLGKVKTGSANVNFTRLENLDLDALAELCAHAHRIVE